LAKCISEAKALFPVGGDAKGTPFEDGPCKAASTAFAIAFEAEREAIDGVGAVRLVLTPPTQLFGPLLFYACCSPTTTRRFDFPAYEDLEDGNVTSRPPPPPLRGP
jgi:hypothetical protein